LWLVVLLAVLLALLLGDSISCSVACSADRSVARLLLALLLALILALLLALLLDMVNSTTITSQYATHLHQAAGSEEFFLWFRTNYQWTRTMINFIDWDAHLAATHKLTFLEKRFLAKFNFQWLPNGHQQHKVDSAQSTVCPLCHTPDVEETETHLNQWPSRLPLVGDLFNKL
jgi:hypothetical protein